MERNFLKAFGDGGHLETANLELSRGLVRFLKAQGTEQVVLCSGSRNAPLIFSLQANNFECFHHVDERSAAFFALGLSMKDRKPVAIVCTSGTAVAEMLPATIEAYYQKLPLILVSADRSESFRGSGAPQAIEQVGIYSQYAECVDIKKPEDFPKKFSYPLHLNIALEEPAAGDWETEPLQIELPRIVRLQAGKSQIGGGDLENSPEDYFEGPPDYRAIEAFVAEAGSLIVVVGSLSPAEGKVVSRFLEKLKAPVLADTTSNLAPSPYLLRCGERLLKKQKPERVLRIGSVPSFRFWRDLEKLSIEVLSLSREGFSGLARKNQTLKVSSFDFLGDLNLELSGTFTEQLIDEDLMLSAKLKALIKKYPESEVAYWSRLNSFIGPEALLYLGNSLPIREWNLVNGVHPFCFANRGANGIDGQISTFLGLADSSSESWALVGDQTALYDLNALAIANQRGKGAAKNKRRIVVMNNGGGKIFSHLSYSSSLDLSQRKVIENQHRWEFRAWADMFAWGYESWQEGSGVLNSAIDDLILEIFPNASQTHHFWLEWRSE